MNVLQPIEKKNSQNNTTKSTVKKYITYVCSWHTMVYSFLSKSFIQSVQLVSKFCETSTEITCQL